MAVRRLAGALWEDHDYVFCTAQGRHLSPGSSVLEPFKVLLKKEGLPDVRFHDFSHLEHSNYLSHNENRNTCFKRIQTHKRMKLFRLDLSERLKA